MPGSAVVLTFSFLCPGMVAGCPASTFGLTLAMPFEGGLSPTPRQMSMAVFVAATIFAALVFVILGTIGANRALTRKVRATIRDLSESEAKYRQLIENASDGMFVADMGGAITYVNEPLAAMLGYAAHELIGRKIFEIVARTSHDEIAAALSPEGVSGDCQMLDVELVGREGKSVFCQINTSGLKREGTAVAIQGVVRDVTQRKRLEEELRRQTEEARRSAAEMVSIHKVAVATTSVLHLPALLEVMYEQVAAIIGNESFFVALFDEQASVIRFEMVVDHGVRVASFTRPYPTGRGLTEWVIRSGEPLFIRDSSMDMERAPAEAITLGDMPLSVIAVPLSVQNRVIGVMSVQSYTQRFEEGHLRIMCTIGTQAAIAIENARLYRELQAKNELLEKSEAELRRVNAKLDRQLAEVTRLHQIAERLAITDSVTGLFNHRHFQERLAEELARCERYGRYLSLLMVDIDDFKQYNDVLGHPAGDAALKAVARLLTRSVRSTDIVARYGGEEFVVVLLEAHKTQALRVAEKIRERVEAYPFPDEDRIPSGRVTVTVGVATYPTDAKTQKDLIYLADMACYRGKREGRNRVIQA
ncbi:MAG: diguanylate cyclase [Firmicutes bacterium]|jgi:diguanylate cyclase (GGDEF)-like protein/PAS domain S-box-containing protein|nr:diguanylate cyclase [Bacillota bacterium]MDH7495659.1 diguanylate cyclase [Bacillota bacterium]